VVARGGLIGKADWTASDYKTVSSSAKQIKAASIQQRQRSSVKRQRLTFLYRMMDLRGD